MYNYLPSLGFPLAAISIWGPLSPANWYCCHWNQLAKLERMWRINRLSDLYWWPEGRNSSGNGDGNTMLQYLIKLNRRNHRLFLCTNKIDQGDWPVKTKGYFARYLHALASHHLGILGPLPYSFYGRWGGWGCFLIYKKKLPCAGHGRGGVGTKCRLLWL